MKKRIFALTLILISLSYISAQELDELQVGARVTLVLKDGSSLTGNVIDFKSKKINFATKSLGEFSIPVDEIERIQTENKTDIGDKFEHENPQATKYILSESAIGLLKGEGFYQNFQLFGNVLAYGCTDKITINLGIETSSPILLDESPYVMLGAKYTNYNSFNKINFGGGINIFTNFKNSENPLLTSYGVATIGNRNKNFTVGIGVGYHEAEFVAFPLFQMGGQARFSKKWGTVFESLIFVDKGDIGSLSSFSLRYMAYKLGFDFGLLSTIDGDLGPQISITFRF